MSQQACRAFFDAWNRRAFDEAMSYVADDCQYDDFAVERPLIGKADIRSFFESFAKQAPGVTFEILESTCDRDVD